jgi:predicted outer membrane repeat protein
MKHRIAQSLRSLFSALSVISLSAVSLLAGHGKVAFAVTRAFPGPAPCDTSLQACIDGSANGDVIAIAAGSYSASVTLNKPVSLVGAGRDATMLNALPNQRVITVSGAMDASVRIANLTVSGGNTPNDSGGGIWLASAARPTMEGIAVRNSTALNGGGIAIEGAAAFEIRDGLIENNVSRSNGGAIYTSWDGAVRLINTQVISNIGSEGGGVYALGDIELIDSTFVRNRTAGFANGGGVYSGLGTGSITSTRTAFIENTARNSGAAIYATYKLVTIEGSRFLSNTAGANGGAIHTFADVTISDSRFEGNTSSNGGGVFTNASVFATDSLFIGNRAGQAGGVRAAEAAHLERCRFEANWTQSRGGGVYAWRTLVLTDTDFINNTASGNAASGAAGADVGTTSNGYVRVTGGLFQGNVSTGRGGGLAVSSGSDSMILKNVRFISNTADIGGGLQFVGRSSEIHNTQFISNTAKGFTGAGGGMSASISDDFLVSDGLFQGNVAVDGGGASIGGDGAVSVVRTRFVNNASTYALIEEFNGGGGGLYVQRGTISDSVFEGNRANNQGGGIYGAVAITLTRTSLINNTARLGGGLAIVGWLARGNVNNVVFARNVASQTVGNAIYVSTGLEAHIVHTTIASAQTMNGSAIAVDSYGSTEHPSFTPGQTWVTNTIVSRYQVGLANEGASSGVTVQQDYNLFHGTATTATNTTGGAHSIVADPSFANPAAGDYRLTAASHAIGRGTNAGLSLDFEAEARPQGNGFDIGADESPFADGPPLPPQPTPGPTPGPTPPPGAMRDRAYLPISIR